MNVVGDGLFSDQQDLVVTVKDLFVTHQAEVRTELEADAANLRVSVVDVSIFTVAGDDDFTQIGNMGSFETVDWFGHFCEPTLDLSGHYPPRRLSSNISTGIC